MHALLGSVLHGFPIGSILVWDTDEDIESAPRVGPIEVRQSPSGLVSYLLDGQQRISTLVGTLRLQDEDPSIVDLIDWRVYFDLENREFMRAPKGTVKAQHFPLASLLNTAGFFDACRRILRSDDYRCRKWLDEADRLASAFRDYQLPLIHIQEANLDTAVTVFARLNRTGRKMAADEMVSALTYRKGEFHLAEELDIVKGNLAKRGFGNLDRVLLLRAVLAALDRDIYAKDWADLLVKSDVRSKLPDGFASAADGLNSALGFLKNLGVMSDRLLPYGLQFVFLGEFYRLCPQPDAEAIRLLERWFWVTSFTGWFGGVNSTQATRALREIQDLARGERNGFSTIDLEAPALPFPARFDGRSARVRAFLLYLASLQPLSLTDPDQQLYPEHLFSSLGTRALGYLTSNKIVPTELYSSPANRVFLDTDLLGLAFSHLTQFDENTLKRLLPTHGFPEDVVETLKSGDFATVIRARLETLINGEREFLVERNVMPPAERSAESVADSDATDDDA